MDKPNTTVSIYLAMSRNRMPDSGVDEREVARKKVMGGEGGQDGY